MVRSWSLKPQNLWANAFHFIKLKYTTNDSVLGDLISGKTQGENLMWRKDEQQFHLYTGISIEHLDSDTPKRKRKNIISAYHTEKKINAV